MTRLAPIFIGQAGWSIGRAFLNEFPVNGSHLERFAQVLSGVEINSSFYRPHRPSTYRKWAQMVPESFRFAVKSPREITHNLRLHQCEEELERFLGDVSELGPKLGPLLFQLPPSLAFDSITVTKFLTVLRDRFTASVVFEPRHRSWFKPTAGELLRCHQIARAAADPACCDGAKIPGGFLGVNYYRWHGSPVMYRSEYPMEAIVHLSAALSHSRAHGATEIWCIFDNTAEGAALGNALEIARLQSHPEQHQSV